MHNIGILEHEIRSLELIAEYLEKIAPHVPDNKEHKSIINETSKTAKNIKENYIDLLRETISKEDAKILELIYEEEKTIKDIDEISDLSFSHTSNNVKKLYDKSFLGRRKDGKEYIYFIAQKYRENFKDYLIGIIKEFD